MRYYLDFEYAWGDWYTQGGAPYGVLLSPISLGIVGEDDRELYIIFGNRPSSLDTTFIGAFVIPILEQKGKHVDPIIVSSFVNARSILLDFIGDDVPEFWGECAAHDYVALSGLFERFEDYPKNWPYFIRDIAMLGIEAKSMKPHHALFDAYAIKQAHENYLAIDVF